MTTLLSRNNPKIKQIHQLLRQRKQRHAAHSFVVEGIRHVGEACEARAKVEYICYAPGMLTSDYATQLIQEQSEQGVPCLAVSNETFSSLAEKDNPQGLLAVVHEPEVQLDDVCVDSFKLGVGLVAPQDPGNIGSILRTIDAVGASGLLLLDDLSNNQLSADPYHPNAVRASMGALFWYPVIKADFYTFVKWAKNHGYKIIGTSAHASQDYHSVEKYALPMILLMGSEREGLTASQAAACDQMLRISMQGRVTSLNLAVATGIMLYAINQKK
ncbi:MAG: TrmH family RNA methyltransferase [Acidobacteriaceae bacterium]